jgi:hypothetical protein
MTDIATPIPTTDAKAHGVLLTDAAAEKVKSLLQQENRDDLRLRVAVQPGGCSGLIYQLYFDERFLDRRDGRRDVGHGCLRRVSGRTPGTGRARCDVLDSTAASRRRGGIEALQEQTWCASSPARRSS